MPSLSYLYKRFDECSILVDKINSIRNELQKAAVSIEPAINIGCCYSIDNVSADGYNIKIQKENIFSIINNLDADISNINKILSSIKKQIEEENKIEVFDNNVGEDNIKQKLNIQSQSIEFYMQE